MLGPCRFGIIGVSYFVFIAFEIIYCLKPWKLIKLSFVFNQMDLSCVYEGVPDCGLSNGNRRLTDEEWDKYQKVTEDSEGFDTVRFPIEVVECGLIMPVVVCEKDFAREYEMYKKCSQAALDVYNQREDTQFQFGKVLKTNALFCRSCTFYLTFQARDTITHVCENFQAKVRIFMQDTPDVELVRLEGYA
ncbi:uncharacterized protein LOC131328957 isoform X2 [Rhododendron vialii]|uniref:uncharacterized protein LOC131328957 isoform X2 n=2 Tax=Rhododendron vialii TaxID=182163 RepID=UPI00265F0FA9|nr:uncharacterized protein LOC131328957 isoform X2 [Rhododendron vialii]